ncbi:MAG: LytTR family DNA-binding domain-containing protein [Bacteroidota bacterium]
MEVLKTILVDDEESALRTLSGMIEQFCPQLQIVGKARGIKEAAVLINKQHPQLVFLDIEMPPYHKGFDLFKLVPRVDFGVIFTTAHTNYAIQAINQIQPWGYLVKPFRVQELVGSVKIAQESYCSKQPKSTSNNQGIMVSDRRKGNVVIRFDDLLYCKADHHTTDLFYQQNGLLKKINSSTALGTIQDNLPKQYFFRSHHSYLVNMNHILSYHKTGRNGLIKLSYDCEAPISVKKMEAFEQHFRTLLHKI